MAGATRVTVRGVAGDDRPGRARLVRGNAATLDLPIPIVVADGTVPPFPPGRFDEVLIDAPCSGLGALRRRADARWRITEADVDELAALQRRLLTSAADRWSDPVAAWSTASAR